jgi:hypothetical protein
MNLGWIFIGVLVWAFFERRARRRVELIEQMRDLNVIQQARLSEVEYDMVEIERKLNFVRDVFEQCEREAKKDKSSGLSSD